MKIHKVLMVLCTDLCCQRHVAPEQYGSDIIAVTSIDQCAIYVFITEGRRSKCTHGPKTNVPCCTPTLQMKFLNVLTL